jgi:two-component system response regulator NreC
MKAKRPIHVVIAEDHILLRQLIAKFLCDNGHPFRLAAAAETVKAAVHACIKSTPDLLLLRLGLIGADDEIAISRLRKKLPDIKILLYAGPSATDTRIARALRGGAEGLLGKARGVDDFLEAINRVIHGDTYFCPETSRILSKLVSGRRHADKTLAGLSPRESEILQLIADGQTNKQIAHLLEISVVTVDTHRRNLMAKVGAHNTADLIRYALRHDLLRIGGSS